MARTSAEHRAEAFKTILLDKGLLSEDISRNMQEAWDSWVPENGARVVARAWIDPEFKARLLEDGTKACTEFGIPGAQGTILKVLENTPALQNAIVCTLCSCSAWPVIGLPSDWYKSFEYRSRVVRQARQVLKEMGLDLPAEVKIQVWDTTAETRYMALPFRPDGTEGWSEAELASIVSKECLVGVARPKAER